MTDKPFDHLSASGALTDDAKCVWREIMSNYNLQSSSASSDTDMSGIPMEFQFFNGKPAVKRSCEDSSEDDHAALENGTFQQKSKKRRISDHFLEKQDVAMTEKMDEEGSMEKQEERTRPPPCEYVVVHCRTKQEQEDLIDELEEACDMAATLVYADYSTQLSPGIQTTSVKAVLICYNKVMKVTRMEEFKVLKLALVSLENLWLPGAYNYSREFLQRVITKPGLLVFGGQELLEKLLVTYNFPELGVLENCFFNDVSIMCWLLDPDNQPKAIEEICRVYNIHDPEPPDQLAGWQASHYSDMIRLAMIVGRVFSQMEEGHLLPLYQRIEQKIIVQLALMSCQFVEIRRSEMTKTSDIMKEALDQLEQRIYNHAGQAFNVNSPMQLREVLFTKLNLHTNLEPVKSSFTLSGEMSTSESVLKKLATVHELPGLILEYRKIQKLKSTYFDGLLRHAVGDKLKAHWNQTGCASGRVTAISPNIQSIPKTPVDFSVELKTAGELRQYEEHINVRDFFISKPKWSFVSADYQQIELRLFAHFSRDPILVQHFVEQPDRDIFADMAALGFGKARDDVNQIDRESTKRLVYSVLYGAGAEKLAENLQIPVEAARNMRNAFLAKFPALDIFRTESIAFAEAHLHQRTLFNRKRFFPDIRSGNWERKSIAERQAVNFRIQGSTADLAKAGMVKLNSMLKSLPFNVFQPELLCQIHDEVIIHTPDHLIGRVAEFLKHSMEDSHSLCEGFGVQLRVPLKTTVKVGKSWGNMTEIK